MASQTRAAACFEMALSCSIRRYTFACVTALTLALAHGPSVARAEPLVISVEAQAALPIDEPQSSWFGPGGALAVAAHYPLHPVALLGLRLRAGLLSDGDSPQLLGVEDPGMGSFELASLVLRLRPLGKAKDERLATGLFVDLGAGGGITGSDVRPSVEAGLGYGFGLGAVSLAPTLRYLQVIQPEQAPSGDDARLLLAGLELSFNDHRPKPQPARVNEDEPASDRDGDGIADSDDSCPAQAEDLDGFEDDDGCPDPDNDSDGVQDPSDQCPNDPEDLDGFEDEDGCPEPDNDGDGIPDERDNCPDAPEVVNGNADEDGCPDEGKIELKNGRIVLEERVLFDFQRARVKTRAKPVLEAIALLRSQHPEWGDIHIEGHADARGDTVANQVLSERRAKNVLKALVDFGVPAERMTSAGYGATRLRDLGTSEEAHQRNRRVEFVVETPLRATKQPPPAAVETAAPEAPRAPLIVTPQPPPIDEAIPVSEPRQAQPEPQGAAAPAPAVTGSRLATQPEHSPQGETP